jgi:hypothetical protein
MRSSQLIRAQKKMGMVGTTRRLSRRSPANSLSALSPLDQKNETDPLTAQVRLERDLDQAVLRHLLSTLRLSWLAAQRMVAHLAARAQSK